MKWLKSSFGRLLCKIRRWIADVWHHASPILIYKFFDEDLQMCFDGCSCGWADGDHVFSPPLLSVLSPDEYGLIELDKDNKGNFQAKIIARGITNRTEAEKLVTSINTANIFANYIPTLFDTFDGGGPSGIHFDDEEFPDRIEPYNKPLMEMLHKGIEQLHSQGLSKSFIKTININHFPSGKSTNQAALNMLREHLTEAELGELEPLMNKAEA